MYRGLVLTFSVPQKESGLTHIIFPTIVSFYLISVAWRMCVTKVVFALTGNVSNSCAIAQIRICRYFILLYRWWFHFTDDCLVLLQSNNRQLRETLLCQFFFCILFRSRFSCSFCTFYISWQQWMFNNGSVNYKLFSFKSDWLYFC